MPLTPKNRKEEWLQGLVDHETTLTPKNRPEEWMKEIIDASGSGGGGGGGGVLVVHASGTPLTLDKTWNEINDAAFTIIKQDNTEGYNCLYVSIVYTGDEENPYGLTAFFNDFETVINHYFETNSADGYPILTPPAP